MQADNMALKAVLNIIANGSDSLYASLCTASVGILDISRINQLSIDSRELTQKGIFIALFGQSSNGHDYKETALVKGCKLMFVESLDPNNVPVLQQIETSMGPHFEIEVYHLGELIADIANRFYSFPDTLDIFAVTGTNGKTSVANICSQLLSLLGKASATVGTLGVQTCTNGVFEHSQNTRNTTPDVVSLCRIIDTLLRNNVNQIAIEASSHGLALQRLGHLPIKCAVFTNLSQDHLDFHASMQEYAAAKRLLLHAPKLRHIVLNADDAESANWVNELKPSQNVYWFSLKQLQFFEIGEKQGCWVSNIEYTTQGSAFTLHSSWGSQVVHIGLIGEFNIANVLAAVTALLALGYAFDDICQHLQEIKGVAGRMELFASAKASVLVDYAHTPDALKQALIAARAHTKGNLYCVFGCGGDRDNSKRAMMGAVAQEFADFVYLTQDNSRSELPEKIIEDIQKGISDSSKMTVELNREQAITFAWNTSQSGDMLLVAGKGHEDYMEISGARKHYDERAFVKKLTQYNTQKNIQNLQKSDSEAIT